MKHRPVRGAHRRGGRHAAPPRRGSRTPGARLLTATLLGLVVSLLEPSVATAPDGIPDPPAQADLLTSRAATPAATTAPFETGVGTGFAATSAPQRQSPGCESPVTFQAPRSTARDVAAAGGWSGLRLGDTELGCDPLGAAAVLPPTALERQEPERLYALVTPDLAVDPKDYAPDDLVPLFGGPYEAREEVARQLAALFAEAEENGHDELTVISGFRDHSTQAQTHEDWSRRVGPQRAEQVSAQPGHSEHQLGLAVDITGTCGGFTCFGDSADGEWVAANAHRFGFIIRYPEGGEEVAGYGHEPWHLRYVGPRAALAMHLRGAAYWDHFQPVALEAAGVGR